MKSDINSRPMLRKIGFVTLIIAAVIFIAFAKYISEWSIFCKNAVTVNAVVTGCTESSYKSGGMYYPDVTYECNGREYTVRLYEGSKTPYTIGAVTTVTVDGDDPGKILAQPEAEYIFVGVLLILMTSSISAAAFIQLKNTPEE